MKVSEVLEEKFTTLLCKDYKIPENFKKTTVKILLNALNQRWKISCRNRDKFLKKNKKWLENNTITFPNPSDYCNYGDMRLETPPSKKIKNDTNYQKQKDFCELSSRSQNRVTKELRESDSSPEMDAYSAAYKFKQQGNKDAYLLLKDIACSSLNIAKAYRESYLEHARTGSMSPEKAIAHILDCKLSRNTYQQARNTFVNMNNEGYPPYNKVLEAKKACYPENFTVEGYRAQVPLQSLCNHTAERLCKYLDKVIDQLNFEECTNLMLHFKYGSDGSSSQSNYKQQFINENGHSIDDSSVYVSSMVPLQLVTVKKNGKLGKILWTNDKPSSPMYCRPISINFAKETTEYIIDEKVNLENQISNLVSHTFNISFKNIKICYQFMPTMYDVKSINAITNTIYTKECYICSLRDKDLSDVDKTLITPINNDNLKYGISSLHAWIRCFECLINLAYKLSICQSQARKNDGTQDIVKQQKEYIQSLFKDKLNLRVDQPKQIAGNSNDGNTARAFFNNKKMAAEITGVNLDLINRFHVILETLSSGHVIDHEKYKEYGIETARLFREKYPWFNISPTIHKVLLHGAEIIKHANLPIGQLSEEAAESTNKYVRQFRLLYTRKCDRKKTMNDLFCRLLANSDPLIASMRYKYKKPLKPFSHEARAMLKAPEVPEVEEVVDQIEMLEPEPESDIIHDYENEDF